METQLCHRARVWQVLPALTAQAHTTALTQAGLRPGAGRLGSSMPGAETHEKSIWEESGRGAGRKGMVFHRSRQETCPAAPSGAGGTLQTEGRRCRRPPATPTYSEVETRFLAFSKLPSHGPAITQRHHVHVNDFCPA